MNFHDARFPAPLSVGSSGGPERRTEIVTLNNGHEERNSPWSQSRRRYDAGLGIQSLDDLHAVVAFFEARQGQLYGFRWKDWTYFKSCIPSGTPAPEDQALGVADGTSTAFQLIKTYRSGTQSYVRRITKPVSGSVSVASGGGVKQAGLDYSVDHAVGVVRFEAPPAAGLEVTAGYMFDVPVRFDADRISASMAGFAAGQIPSIPVVEVRV